MSSRRGMLSSNTIKYNIFNKNYTKHTFNYFENFKNYGRIDKNPIYNQTTIDKRVILLEIFLMQKYNYTQHQTMARMKHNTTTQTQVMYYSDNQCRKLVIN